MNKTRYRAHWTIDFGKQVEGEDFNPDVVNYGSKYFSDLRTAQLHAYEHDLFDEGRVCVEELRTEHDLTHGTFLDWQETEEEYFIDGPTLDDVGVMRW